jgi:PAS domain S-box-containing protein
LIFEAAEAAGIPRTDLTRPLGLDAAYLSETHHRVEWRVLASVLDRLSLVVHHDADAIRAVGSHMVRVPSYEFIQHLARDVVSLRMFYRTCQRWLAPALFPHLPLTQTFLPGDRLRLEGHIPEPHAPSAAFFHIFEGVLCEMPRLMGLPRARLEHSNVTPRACDLTLVLPPSVSGLQRAQRRVRALFRAPEAMGRLEDQHGQIRAEIGALQKSSAELHALLDCLPDLVIIHRDGTIVWANRTAVAALDYERREDLIGKPLLEIADDTSKPLVQVRMRMPEGAMDDPALTEARLRRRDGDVVMVEVAPTQSVTFGGAPARLVVGRDVTERVRMQQRLVTADRLASIGMLAAGVAHEINNPLAYVLGNIEIVERELAPYEAQMNGARQALAIAREGVGRIRTIVRDLLKLSRADERGLGPVDVHPILDSTLALAARAIAARARVVRDYHPIPPANADGARLGQVFMNLIVNALEAMGGTPPEANELRIRTSQAASGAVVIEFTDTGGGIPAALVARIFDPFFTTKPAGRGTGLGLAICQRIVSELKGEITVESEVGRGTTFRIVLPSAPGPALRPSAYPRESHIS